MLIKVFNLIFVPLLFCQMLSGHMTGQVVSKQMTNERMTEQVLNERMTNGQMTFDLISNERMTNERLTNDLMASDLTSGLMLTNFMFPGQIQLVNYSDGKIGPDLKSCLQKINQFERICIEKAFLQWNVKTITNGSLAKDQLKNGCCALWDATDCFISHGKNKCTVIQTILLKSYQFEVQIPRSKLMCDGYPYDSVHCYFPIWAYSLIATSSLVIFGIILSIYYQIRARKSHQESQLFDEESDERYF